MKELRMQIKKERQDKSFAIKFTAEEEGKVVGWAYIYIIINDLHDEPYALLENVFVEEEYRGKGIGSELIQAMLDEALAEGCYKIIGTSRHSRPKVHELYKKIGFKDWGVEFRMDLKESKSKK